MINHLTTDHTVKYIMSMLSLFKYMQSSMLSNIILYLQGF
jgi:hypothetical protein